MKALLRLRKSVEKLTGSSRGFSSVIGTIFMVLLVVTSIAGVFLSTLYQNTLYNYAVRGQNQQELDVRNENVVANGNYSVSGGKVSVIANLTNAGPVTAQIVNLWVFDTSRQTYGFNNSVGNKPWANLSWTTLKAGQVLKFTSNNATKVTVPNATQGDSLSIWFVTARGNTVPLTKSQGITITNIPGTSQGIGSIAMDFKKFSHYDFSSTPGDGTALGNPKFTYTIAAGNSTILHVLLTNFDSSGQSINLTQSSKLWCITPFSGTVKGGDMWGLLNVTGGKVYPSSSKYFLVLQYGKATDVYFGPAGGSGNNKLSSAGNVVPLNILLFGKIGNSDYGQNLPFIALNVLNQWKQCCTDLPEHQGKNINETNFFWHYEFSGTPAQGTSLPSRSPKNYITSEGKYTVYHVMLTDLGPFGKNIVLNGNSSINIIGQHSGTVKYATWGLVNVTNNKIYPSSGVRYNLPYGVLTELYFSGTISSIDYNNYPLNILLCGTKGNNDHGQNILFVSIYLVPW